MGKAVAKAANGKWQMNPKPLFIASLIAATLAAMALEGGALSFGQAVAILAPASVLAAWSFTQTDWWEGSESRWSTAQTSARTKSVLQTIRIEKKAKPLILRLFAVLKYAEVISDHNSEDGDRNENCI